MEGIYFLLLIFLILKIKTYSFNGQKVQAHTCFSIIIPFRNESSNLKSLLHSLNNLDYPKEKFEVIFVNDQSNDSSVQIINNTEKKFQYRIIHIPPQEKSGKKYALTKGIQASEFETIITLDADIIIPPGYLAHSNEFWLNHPESKLMSAPVLIKTKNKSLLEILQSVEFLALQIMTFFGFQINRPFLANGANLQFKKSAYETVNGYTGFMDYAGGDDIFLLWKIHKKYPGKSHYTAVAGLKVTTQAVQSYKEWFEQRIRWSKKNLHKFNPGFFFVILQVIAVISILYKTLDNSIYTETLGIFELFLMLLLHFWLLNSFAEKLNEPFDLKKFSAGQILLPVLYFILFFKIIFNDSFQWKNRRFNK